MTRGAQLTCRTLTVWLFLAGLTPAMDPVFERDIQPLLKNRCVKCHGSLKPEGRLNLGTPAGLARGGESGAAILAGKPAESPLWLRVEHDEMPPKDPLTADEKNLLQRWILAGASGLPGDVGTTGSGADHWAFQPLRPPGSQSVTGLNQSRSTIDLHVQARLESAGLTLSATVSREALIRRVSLDLTGLPPSVAEIDEFLGDSDAAAYERMVDRYLSSPRFGERWGKHWLDAAGYADSNGYFSADTDRPHAWRYRDYVIQSLNADKPFDRFIREQLAGDEMAGFRPGQPVTPEIIELLDATHFLRNGQDGTDIGVQEPEAFEIDRRAALEAVVQVTATSLLGLTVHCARCHDHKYDPITQQEYYQFQAILFPAFNPQNWINPKDRVIYAYLPGEKEAWESDDRRIQEQITQLQAEYAAWIAEHREPSEILLAEAFDADWTARWSNTAPGDEFAGGEVSIGGTAANSANVQNGALQIIAGPSEAWLSTTTAYDWTPDEVGTWIQATFDLVDDKVGGGSAMRIGYLIGMHDFNDSGTVAGGNLLVDGNPMTGTNLYLDYPGGDQRVVGLIGSIGYSPGRNYGVRITNIGEGKFRLDHVVDGLEEGPTLNLTAADLADGGFGFLFCVNRSFVVDNVRIERSARTAENIDLAQLRKTIQDRRTDYEKQRAELLAKRTPEPGRAIAWVTDKSAEAPVVPLLTRGLYHLREGNLEPNALSALSDDGTEFRVVTMPTDSTTTGRRSGLADWITRPEGRAAALMARVHVNRVWRQYFGRGIVATTDNFGISGAAPSHPELLEDLASEFIHQGWSQKALHRRIVTSAVYQQASAPNPDGLSKDPDNRLLWRWPVRRLEAELVRDGMLAAAGQLDDAPFGKYVPTRQTTVGEVIVDEQTAGARRRSVYLQQRRSQTLSMLKVFDAPAVATICTTRPSSTVPLQSLALLNSDFSVARAEAFARRLLSETDGSPAEVIRRAWRVAIGREPTSDEQQLAGEFLATQQQQYTDNEAGIWAVADFCQMLLASNAFLYLE